MTEGRAEEFAEILAHHAERAGDLGRTARYAALAKKFWGKATTQHFEGEFNWVRSLGLGEKTSKK